MEAQMNLPRLLFDVGFRIFFFIVTPRMIKRLSSLLNMLRTCEVYYFYSLRCILTLYVPSEDSMAAIWVVFG